MRGLHVSVGRVKSSPHFHTSARSACSLPRARGDLGAQQRPCGHRVWKCGVSYVSETGAGLFCKMLIRAKFKFLEHQASISLLAHRLIINCLTPPFPHTHLRMFDSYCLAPLGPSPGDCWEVGSMWYS